MEISLRVSLREYNPFVIRSYGLRYFGQAVKTLASIDIMHAKVFHYAINRHTLPCWQEILCALCLVGKFPHSWDSPKNYKGSISERETLAL